ncbi:MAG TPA: recombination regulator RecX [Macromonas sp.]|nr:recombination regulator RecX [Macromonas sp.]
MSQGTQDGPQDPAPPPRRRGPGQPSLKARALRLLAQREHSRLELERKLREHESQPGELAAALDTLAAKGFISDERVADSVLHRRAGKLGNARVKAELQAKGLDEAVVREALASLRSTEQERALEVWRKKFGNAPADASERARQMRFLAARGFAAEVVRRVVSGSGHDDD